MEDFEELLSRNLNRLLNLHCGNTRGCYQCSIEKLGLPSYKISWLSTFKSDKKAYEDQQKMSVFLDECEKIECTCENSKCLNK